MTESRCPYLTVPRFAAVPGLVHGFGDARWSEADFLGFAQARGMRPVIMHQLHTDIVHRLNADPGKNLEGDALMTNIPGLLLVIRTADCLPVLLVDEENRAVAAVHCGWRGTERRILEKAIQAMGDAYGSTPEGMLAALGPCIGPPAMRSDRKSGTPSTGGISGRAYSSSEDTSPRSRCPTSKGSISSTCAPRTPGSSGTGLQEEPNIFNPGPVCTHCEPRLLSFRRHAADPRRMHNFIGLLPAS